MRDSGQPDWKCGEVAGQFELKGAYLERPDRQALRRLADAREAGGPAAARAEPAAARRADELPRPADADPAGTLPAELPRGVPDRLARPGVPRRHLRPHARPVARQADDRSPARSTPFWSSSASSASTRNARTRPILAKRRHLEDFIARNKARAAHRDAGPVEEQAAREAGTDGDRRRRADGPHPRRRGSSRARAPALRCRDLAIGYPERQIAVGHPAGDRPRLAGRGRRRQRPGQDDVPADGRRLAQAARRRGPLGPRLQDRRLRPARLHEPAGEADRPRLPAAAGGVRQEGPGDSRSRRVACCSAGRTSRSRSPCCPAASGPGSAWRACC